MSKGTKLAGLYKQYQTDKTAETEGVWLPIDDEGSEVLLARLPNPEYTRRYNELMRPYKKLLAVGGKVPEEKQSAILSQVMSETILKGWRGKKFQDESGKVVRYTPGIGMDVLNDLSDLRDRITFMAADIENYRVAALEAQSKNSKTTSTGSSGGATK